MGKDRKLILKGKVYTLQGTDVIATNTTCSYSGKYFKGVCIKNTSNKNIVVPGFINDKWVIENFKLKENEKR